MKKILAIVGGILLLVLLFTIPWAIIGLTGALGILISIGSFFYFRQKRRPEKAKVSAMVLGASVVAFAVGIYLTPSATSEKEAVQKDSKPQTEQTTKTTETSEEKEMVLSLAEAVETDDGGTVTIKGTTEPHATIYVSSAAPDEKQTADANGDFELTHTLSTDSEQELSIIAELDGRKISKQLLATPSASFIAAKEEEAAKQAEELRLAEEAKKKQEEIDRLTKEAETAVALAEAEQTRDKVAAASTAIAAIPEGNQGLTSRVSAVDTAIQAREEQEAQQAAAAAAEAEQAAQQEQNNVTEMVLVTRTGEKYHTRKCGNGTYTSATLQEALDRGLTPCSKCFG
ncbi:hypothetical protein [Enterococcus sp. BWR-S5]|uniref:hypothetical protein n=1 Tax=Enterococcus sp. BWR-S5 TaxID=2787714 RepID=UPI0019209F44|nr:hypothetical protein [Enterococcus sp. BWR-S5]MBL1227023.1 hypothetical protein [Enterococcus sp. BWR-S5]